MTGVQTCALPIFLKKNGPSSSKQIFDQINTTVSYATTKRILVSLAKANFLSVYGLAKATRYAISPIYQVIRPIDLNAYYQQEIDERKIIEVFNSEVINEVLANHDVFTESELKSLNKLQHEFVKNTSQLSEAEYKKEFERLAIDLSWKSSDRKSTRLNSSHIPLSRMPSSA